MAGTTLLEQLREKTGELPAEGPPEVVQARRRALQAMATVEAALRVDPTLAAEDRCRDLDVLDELMRQLKPLARQAQLEIERRRLVGLPGTERQIARLGRTNPLALDELDALSQRAVTLAEHIAGQALPDWNTPERIRERSARLLPSPERLEDIAAQLRYAVRTSLELPHPDPEAVRLAALADQIALTTQRRRERCAGPGCDRELDHARTGRPRRYCGAACRQRARRAAHTGQGAPPEERASKRAHDLTDNAAEDALQARLAALPPDTRPMPSVAAYDDLLQRRPRAW